MLPSIYYLSSFAGAFFLGLTAVLLKLADVDNVFYGLIIRACASGPPVLILVLFLKDIISLNLFFNPIFIFELVLAAAFLICADMLIMTILKRKPVGMIAPLIAVFPLFTTILLIITKFARFSPIILFFTSLIIVGVAMVTYERSDPESSQISFDLEAIGFGLIIAMFLGLTNYMDIIIILSFTSLNGLVYTSFKFMMVLCLSSILFVLIHDHNDWKRFQSNQSSTLFLLAAGLSAWGFGSLLIYTAYDNSNPEIVNAIIGINPVFAVLISISLKMERLGILKVVGLLLCVVASIGIVNI